MTEQVLEGGCICGAVRYRMRGKPIFANACHCRDCQKSTGSAFAVNVITEAENVALLSGTLRTDTAPTPSGRGQVIHRCDRCGTRMWSNYGTPDGVRFVASGTLDDPAAITPDHHIFVRSKLPWIDIPEGMPQDDGFYDVKTTWPAESLARWKAVFARG